MKWLKKLISDHSDREPLVIANRICRDIDNRIQIIQGGKKIFAFNHLSIRLFCADQQEEQIIQSAFKDHQLQRHIQGFLNRREVGNWKDIRVTIETTIVPHDNHSVEKSEIFKISYQKNEKSLPDASLIVTRGIATHQTYVLKALTRIGRTEEVVDRHGRLVRRNDFVFVDHDDEINLSVGRIQSRIEYDEATTNFTVYDEHSRYGTMVERNGQMMTATILRGIALLDGDTIHFGRARCQFQKKSGE